MVVSAVTQRERHEVGLQALVNANGAVFGHYNELLILAPAEALDGALVPVQPPY